MGAKKNTAYHDSQVESMLTTAEARQILYERMLPRYQDRAFHFTRVVNMFRYRFRDTAQLGIIEYIDRPGELRPANPVGAARVQHVAQEFLATRRGRRRHLTEMERILGMPGEPPLDARVLDWCRFQVSPHHMRYSRCVASESSGTAPEFAEREETEAAEKAEATEASEQVEAAR